MRLWVDDLRPPHQHGRPGWTWAKTYEEAIGYLKTGNVQQVSLDHDLCDFHYDGELARERSGYHIVLWMEEHGVWPERGIFIHSMTPAGRERMQAVLEKNGKQYALRVPGGAA